MAFAATAAATLVATLAKGVSAVNVAPGPQCARRSAARDNGAPSGDAGTFQHVIRHALTMSDVPEEDVDQGHLATLNVRMEMFASVATAAPGLQSARNSAETDRGARSAVAGMCEIATQSAEKMSVALAAGAGAGPPAPQSVEWGKFATKGLVVWLTQTHHRE